MKLEKILGRMTLPLVTTGLSLLLGFTGCVNHETKRENIKKDNVFIEYVGDLDFVHDILTAGSDAWRYADALNSKMLAERYEKVIADSSQLIRAGFLKKDIPVFYLYRARAKLCLGRLEEALVDVNEVIQLTADQKPAYASPYHYRGRIYEAMGQYGKAMQDYQKAAELYSDNTMYHAYIDNLKGILKEKEGRYSEAANFYRSAAALLSGLAIRNDTAKKNLERVMKKIKND